MLDVKFIYLVLEKKLSTKILALNSQEFSYSINELGECLI